MIIYKNGNILSSNADIICQQVNCQGVMGSGLAKEIRTGFPQCYKEYKMFCKDKTPNELLGKVNFVQENIRTYAGEDRKNISSIDTIRIFANIFGQLNYGKDRKLYTSYPALESGLKEVYQHAREKNFSVAVPHWIGCGHGGGNWNIVFDIIKNIFEDSQIICEIWRLNK
jgi:Predicted phosphatase homologous to the C-terminal domain of histone macroH2A1